MSCNAPRGIRGATNLPGASAPAGGAKGGGRCAPGELRSSRGAPSPRSARSAGAAAVSARGAAVPQRGGPTRAAADTRATPHLFSRGASGGAGDLPQAAVHASGHSYRRQGGAGLTGSPTITSRWKFEAQRVLADELRATEARLVAAEARADRYEAELRAIREAVAVALGDGGREAAARGGRDAPSSPASSPQPPDPLPLPLPATASPPASRGRSHDLLATSPQSRSCSPPTGEPRLHGRGGPPPASRGRPAAGRPAGAPGRPAGSPPKHSVEVARDAGGAPPRALTAAQRSGAVPHFVPPLRLPPHEERRLDADPTVSSPPPADGPPADPRLQPSAWSPGSSEPSPPPTSLVYSPEVVSAVAEQVEEATRCNSLLTSPPPPPAAPIGKPRATAPHAKSAQSPPQRSGRSAARVDGTPPPGGPHSAYSLEAMRARFLPG
jgi:hypothetical protein